ncbi:hypothetical protein KI688_011535 [Linnemannia hyalina]|uniref:GH16 domain-containing protein n=1 Tax=Linnemannia hyalina TaxID=64524 RepID=A0A9P8BT75_9FUNG|nr:hypothetical protein KI688_011535 [Linnemannia hyalina]
MKLPFSLVSLSTLASGLLMMATSPASVQASGFYESLDNHDNFIVAHGWGPERWGGGTKITIGKDSDLKPFSCGELIHKRHNLGYGRYSIDMIASNTVGQVTSFFLIANEVSEIDIELTGLNNKVGWMNVWHDHKQNPVAINLPFDASKGWHNYAFEWLPNRIVWFVDGKVVLNRTDVMTARPEDANYKLAVNSWTQVQKEVNIDWAGKFRYPEDGSIPSAQFKNMKYSPFDDPLESSPDPAVGDNNNNNNNNTNNTNNNNTNNNNNNNNNNNTDNNNNNNNNNTNNANQQDGNSNMNTNHDGGTKDGQRSGADDTKALFTQGFTAIIAVALTFTILF